MCACVHMYPTKLIVAPGWASNRSRTRNFSGATFLSKFLINRHLCLGDHNWTHNSRSGHASMEEGEGHLLPPTGCTPPNAPAYIQPLLPQWHIAGSYSFCCSPGPFQSCFPASQPLGTGALGCSSPRVCTFLCFAWGLHSLHEACWGLDSITTLGLVSHASQFGVISAGIHHSMILCVKKMLNRTGTSIALCDTALVTLSPTILCAEDQHTVQLPVSAQCTSLLFQFITYQLLCQHLTPASVNSLLTNSEYSPNNELFWTTEQRSHKFHSSWLFETITWEHKPCPLVHTITQLLRPNNKVGRRRLASQNHEVSPLLWQAENMVGVWEQFVLRSRTEVENSPTPFWMDYSWI